MTDSSTTLIEVATDLPSDAEAFTEQAWAAADQEHFGKAVDFSKKKFSLVARRDGIVCGIAKLQIKAGIARIDELLVDENQRRLGVGTQLVREMERIAHQHTCHKITLLTGKDWPAVPFYTSLGFAFVAELPNYYTRHDFVELAKEL